MARLPPLNAVRAFEAAARLGSLTRAAGELNVTHGAVSRQVQALETWLGCALFRRANRSIVLTEAGLSYWSEIGPALERIGQATARVAVDRSRRVLRVDALPTFTMRWLIPRLSSFQLEHPAIEVRLTTSSDTPERLRGPVDALVRGGPEQWPGWRAERFQIEGRTPVCRPELIERLPLDRPEQLAGHVLIHSATLPDSWSRWLEAAGHPSVRPAGALTFEHFFQSIQAAVDGLGVAMGPLALVAEELADGRLVMPFAGPVLEARAYHLYVPEERTEDATLRAFRDWLMRAGSRDSYRPAVPEPLNPGR